MTGQPYRTPDKYTVKVSVPAMRRIVDALEVYAKSEGEALECARHTAASRLADAILSKIKVEVVR